MLHFSTLRNTRLSLSPEGIAVVLAVYFALSLNTSLWSALHSSLIDPAKNADYTAFFATGLGLTSFQTGLLCLLLWGKQARWIGALLAVITSALHYFSQQYGTVYNPSMMTNILSTDWREAHEYLGWPLIVHITTFGVLPALALLRFSLIEHQTIRHAIRRKILFVLGAVVITAICIASHYGTLAAVSRNNISLRYAILPTSPILSTLRLVTSAAASPHPATNQPIDALATRRVSSHQRPLMLVLVVGETVRAANWQLSGYQRPTTPNLATMPSNTLFNAPYAESCGTSTEVSVPCMFSTLGRRLYDRREITKSESVVEMLSRIGIQTYWIDNQSGCKGVCDNLSTSAETETLRQSLAAANEYDDWLVTAAARVYDKVNADTLIVLHTLGNHGPAYFLRYPETSAAFSPACKDPSFKACSKEEIENAYDNAIQHTDELLFRTISWLKTVKTHDVALLYVSDHGESLGESGMYLHGLPYVIAPNTQKRVPFVLWIPQDVQDRRKIDAKCLSGKFNRALSHDNLPHSLLGIFNIDSTVYERSLDLFDGCHA